MSTITSRLRKLEKQQTKAASGLEAFVQHLKEREALATTRRTPEEQAAVEAKDRRWRESLEQRPLPADAHFGDYLNRAWELAEREL
jgi:hypothetical protein